MGDEGFEEWDADFLDQLIQVEEIALSSSTNPTQHHLPPPAPPPPPPPPPHVGPSYDNFISYSPPRELSQRIKDNNNKGFDQSSNCIGHTASTSIPYVRRSHNVKESEIDRLKRELGRVSKQLTHWEQECLELRKERDKKEEQLKSVYSQIETKDVEIHCSKSTNLEYGVHIQNHPGISLQSQYANTSNDQIGSRVDVALSTYKAIGVQTEKAGDCTHLTIKNDLSTRHDLSNKLLAIWGSRSGQRSGRNLVSKLFVACATDFHLLFGCLSINMSSKVTMDCLADESSSDLALQDHLQSGHYAEAAKVSHLYSVLTKISNEMVQLEALFEALLDLCSLENVVIVHRSLRILRVVLNYLLSMGGKSDRRENVMVKNLCSGNNIVDIRGSESEKTGGLFCMGTNETSYSGYIPFETRLFNAEILCKNRHWNHVTPMSVTCVDWVTLFEVMHRIAMMNTEERVRLEAVSIMNMILMSSNASLEREKFGQTLVFECVSQLLRKEAGLRVQKQAVHLLYLLLNCPKLLVIFCSGCKEEGWSAGAANDEAKNASSFRGFSIILEGLADCVACRRNGIQVECDDVARQLKSGVFNALIDERDLKLRRNAITVLAFLASSGKSGFEILLGHKLSKRTNFLELILRVLVSEMDVEAAESAEPPEIFKERTLLIREALILLNRLVSSPAYSTAVLRVLTNSRDMASLTTNIATRLSRKGKRLWQSDSMTRHMRESEIVDLTRVFKKRVFTYLGDSIS